MSNKRGRYETNNPIPLIQYQDLIPGFEKSGLALAFVPRDLEHWREILAGNQ